MTAERPAPILVVMGVSGSGKSTVAAALARQLGWDLCEGDGLHPAANVAKMAHGHPLDDTDRAPWLARVHAWIDQHAQSATPGIITCSALKRRYRDQLREPGVVFVELHGARALLLARLQHRRGHFMPAALLDSQLADYEPPADDEPAVAVDIAEPPDVQARQVVDKLGL